MQYYTFVLFGCLIGMQHALEADHLAAVAALGKKSNSRRALVLRGGAWGLGHTVTLLSVCSILWLFGESISPRTAALLEFVVGVMVVLLGVNVLYTMRRQRLHVHVHRHSAGAQHVHVHAHAGEPGPHCDSDHEHEHASPGLLRALLVGMVHGSAGSAGLLVLAAAAGSVAEAIGYVAAFGAGSIIGMATLSFVASYPLRWIERGANWVSTAAFTGIGCTAILVGGHLMGHSWGAL